jgi:SAM-dependent methyltransferase
MQSSYPGPLRIWQGLGDQALSQPDLMADSESEAATRGDLGKPPLFANATFNAFGQAAAAKPDMVVPNHIWSAQKARWLSAREALASSPTGAKHAEEAEAFSLQWFLNIEHQRHHRRGRWIPRLLEFSKHAGETLLAVGNGLGTDWVQYARHGAAVVVCSPSAEALGLIRRNFELRGLSGRFLHSSPLCLPLDNTTIDVVCLGDVLADAPDPSAIVHEVYRVLKPGGKVLALAPAYYEVDYWYHAFFPWQRWFGWNKKVDARTGYSARRLRQLFDGFVEHRVHKRQLRRSEVPHIWRFLPLSLLQRMFGRTLILKAFKPLSAVSAQQMAA